MPVTAHSEYTALLPNDSAGLQRPRPVVPPGGKYVHNKSWYDFLDRHNTLLNCQLGPIPWSSSSSGSTSLRLYTFPARAHYMTQTPVQSSLRRSLDYQLLPDVSSLLCPTLLPPPCCPFGSRSQCTISGCTTHITSIQHRPISNPSTTPKVGESGHQAIILHPNLNAPLRHGELPSSLLFSDSPHAPIEKHYTGRGISYPQDYKAVIGDCEEHAEAYAPTSDILVDRGCRWQRRVSTPFQRIIYPRVDLIFPLELNSTLWPFDQALHGLPRPIPTSIKALLAIPFDAFRKWQLTLSSSLSSIS